MKKLLLLLPLFFVFIAGCASSAKSAGEDVTILPRSSWKALDPKPFKPQVPQRITIHHEGEFFSPDSNSAEKIKKTQVWGMGKDRNWADIPYHFMIDAHGVIFEGRNVFTAGETNTTYDPTGHLLVTLLGNFEEQKVTKEQLNSLVNLLAYCCNKYQISPETIKGHKDYAETLCPGKDLYKYLQDGSLIKMVKEVLKDKYGK
ncbi:MAG: N-acetylmuramoyl-L-alanine amidase [Ignavibacteria bacterium]|nr:N-acetylmuramoyl-L-alanine amidase [Ignavibacteria bacterium]MCU7501473.1 N-acetylmuramoyl-L-alanine amidase [Ignavibacteria bacterium]MCU7516011.1 N-acetylmuramoyl-L-alanine amidase [Ignavibacteria bacterium]